MTDITLRLCPDASAAPIRSAGPLQRLTAAVRSVFGSMIARWEDRARRDRDERSLLGMDDRMLHDIGVSRSMIRDAVRNGRWMD